MPTEEMKKEFDYILEFIEGGDFVQFVEVKKLMALWTAFCLHHGLDPDTSTYNCYALEMWNYLEENLTCPWPPDKFENFGLFMGANLC